MPRTSRLSSLFPAFFAMLGAAVVSTPAHAETYYVAQLDKEASDDNDGSLEAPFLSIERGISALGSGDTLLVKSGNYEANSGQLVISGLHGESEDGRILIANFDGDAPVIHDSREDGADAALEIRDSDYLTISGFEIDNGRENGVNVGDYDGEGVDGTDESVHHVVIEHCLIHDYEKFGVFLAGGFNTVRNSEIFGDEAPDDENGIVGVWVDGHDNLVEGNEIYNHWAEVKNGDAVGLHGEGDNIVRGNLMHDSTDDCLDGWHSGGYNIVEDNTCFRAGFGSDGEPHPSDEANGMGIKVNGLQPGSGHHWIIRRNVVFDNKTGGISNEDAGEGNIWLS